MKLSKREWGLVAFGLRVGILMDEEAIRGIEFYGGTEVKKPQTKDMTKERRSLHRRINRAVALLAKLGYKP